MITNDPQKKKVIGHYKPEHVICPGGHMMGGRMVTTEQTTEIVYACYEAGCHFFEIDYRAVMPEITLEALSE
jgi:hypothetical protein